MKSRQFSATIDPEMAQSQVLKPLQNGCTHYIKTLCPKVYLEISLSDCDAASVDPLPGTRG